MKNRKIEVAEESQLACASIYPTVLQTRCHFFNTKSYSKKMSTSHYARSWHFNVCCEIFRSPVHGMTLNLNWQFSIIGSQRRRFQGGKMKVDGKIEHSFLDIGWQHTNDKTIPVDWLFQSYMKIEIRHMEKVMQ